MLRAGAGRVIAFDQDPDAIENGPSLVPDSRLTLIHDRFSRMADLRKDGANQFTSTETPVAARDVQVRQGAVEKANVQPETEKNERIDILQHMLDSGARPDTGLKMSNQDIIDQMSELLLAGSETTSGTIACNRGGSRR